ncbi:DUF3951 domain-containing protein [Paenibacillus guangzhouensis]|uniref:DUF3951 domain-containing protein n=1 Tax=Paenibacillus guangzhouensis TaxID=1473112 RepID=UPI001266AAB8|nr:DUF3951 domain-containing protein [Paenibacillus guangzhouensis]
MDNVTPFIILSLILPIFVLLGIISVKMIRRKELPSNQYTPFDYIMGQSAVEFHVEKEEHEEQDDQGDDKNKNTRR